LSLEEFLKGDNKKMNSTTDLNANQNKDENQKE